MSLTEEQASSFNKNGYLILRNILTPSQTALLQRWAQEVHDWPTTTSSPWMPYEEINSAGKHVLCRTENYANHHSGLNSLLRGSDLLSLLAQLSGEKMLLFKEKINYKLAGSGGFSPHIDSTAYTHIKNIKHLTILLAVDPSNQGNGGLEVVSGSHEMNVPINPEDNCIEPSWVAAQDWTPVNLEPGELLVFGSYLAHRSGANQSSKDRKAIYATYNCDREGDLHDSYYEDRRTVWPPTHLRRDGETYEEGAMRYGFGSPMLSVGLGKQLVQYYYRPSSPGSKVTTNSHNMASISAKEMTTHILSLLTTHGQSDYIGEPISQLSHSLQAAHFAAELHRPRDTVIAALLHDIGQFIPASDLRSLASSIKSMPSNVGRVGHETLGAAYLRKIGFSENVAALVAAHVPAKRFLCATVDGYWEGLSDASKQSLKFQGGKMNDAEVEEWKRQQWWEEMVALRTCDDAAKVEGLEVKGVEGYRALIEEHLLEQREQ
ncbi:PhyH-domain-containing protein [Aulographum hederae CBS 113979]|uniref:PhyH-domain-containing protein n=1 Tax=Aulographum hederae CBS 113979 TaxID=1176131 RepID=A0A6G1GJ58_9PEZI|nr:PhyH-domain-containing protein [Aulographum hederae CBS 113979]